MLDLLALQIEQHLSFRWLFQVVLLSAGLTLAAVWSFRDDAGTRRGLGVAAIWLLALVPLALLLLQPRYQIGVRHLPELPTLPPVPWLLLVAWLLLALWGCGKVAWHVLQTLRSVKSLPVITDPALSSMAESYCSRLGLEMPAFVYGHNCCASSVGSATVMLPQQFLEWPENSQRAVIAHELVHLHRRDDRFMIALQALTRCYLFCPWLHLLYARFVHSLEEACDERAAELVGARSDYLEGLAGAALREGDGSYSEQPAAHLIDAKHKSVFMQRLARLLDKQRFFEVQDGPLAAGTGVGLLVLCALTTFEFVTIPPSPFAGAAHRSVSVLPLRVRQPQNFRSRNTMSQPEVRVIDNPGQVGQLRPERITPAIIYPGQALLDGIEGQVLMEFSIATDGSTVRPRILRSTHPKYFNSTATRAVQQTVYTPEYKTGFSGVNAAFRFERTSAHAATDRVQKLFVFDLPKDHVRGAYGAEVSTE